MKRNVWSVEELLALLRMIAMMGGDAKTLAAIAIAIGVEPRMIEEGR